MKLEFHIQKFIKVKVELIEFLKMHCNFNVYSLDFVQCGSNFLLDLLGMLSKIHSKLSHLTLGMFTTF